VSDEIRRLSDELARDPSSLVFLQLGESLRRQGQTDLAHRVAVRGLERHPHNADAHDLLARIAVDRGELERAFDEWDMVLRLAPAHTGAKKGLGFVCFRQGRLAEAEQYLSAASIEDGQDAGIASALAHVRAALGNGNGRGAHAAAVAAALPTPAPATPTVPPPSGGAIPAWLEDTPEEIAARERRQAEWRAAVNSAGSGAFPRDPRLLFADVIGEDDQTALLLDADGFVLAGAYVAHDGHDVAQEVGAELSGVSDEASRAMRHLDLGDWSTIVVETEVATIALAPAPNDGLLLAAAAKAMPLGMVRRFVDRCLERARRWLERQA
jgi:predicted regulator of Ras-like GTPase activity (Roadblock/LC7/MglB family)